MKIKNRILYILVFLTLLLGFILSLTFNSKLINNHRYKNRELSEETDFHIPKTQKKNEFAQNNRESIRIMNIMSDVKRQLIAEHNIHVSTEEIRNFLRKEIGPAITPEFLDKTQKFGIAMISASENVLHGTMTAKQAVEHFLSEYGMPDTYVKILEKQSTQERINEMRRMFPDDKGSVIEKSIKGYREILETRQLAEIVLPDEFKPDNNPQWGLELDKWAFNYAKEHLITQYPELNNYDFKTLFTQMPLHPVLIESRPESGVPPGPRISNGTNNILMPME